MCFFLSRYLRYCGSQGGTDFTPALERVHDTQVPRWVKKKIRKLGACTTVTVLPPSQHHHSPLRRIATTILPKCSLISTHAYRDQSSWQSNSHLVLMPCLVRRCNLSNPENTMFTWSIAPMPGYRDCSTTSSSLIDAWESSRQIRIYYSFVERDSFPKPDNLPS